jgi:uncharacterized protein YndB with AHSA1/START domain
MSTYTTTVNQLIYAPRVRVYNAILDAQAVHQWLVPDGMTCRVHRFEPRVGGFFRISLTYESPTEQGKTSAHTDTYHGTFVELIPGQKVVQVMVFETDDPSMMGEMRVTYELFDAKGDTLLRAEHDFVPEGISPADNELGWRMSMEKLANLFENSPSKSA